MERVVILQSQNERKVEELRAALAMYGLTVVQDRGTHGWIDAYGPGEESRISQLLQSGDYRRKVIAVMRDQSDLFESADDHEPVKPENLTHLKTVTNVARLQVWNCEGQGENAKLARKDYTASVSGHINTHLTGSGSTFSWDDIFVNRDTQMTYEAMDSVGLKRSARNQALAQWIKEHLHYEERKDVSHQPIEQEGAIDFSNSVSSYVAERPNFNNAYIERYGIKRMIRAALNTGIYFKSPGQRRELNYWLTVGNAGMTLTPKLTEVHQDTYMAHDLFHFLWQELVVDGMEDLMERKVYIFHRLMSEAVTMVMADMLFLDTVNLSGIEHDYSKHVIYTFFKSLQLDPQANPEIIPEMLRANAHYILRGDDSYWVALGATGEAFETFKVAASHFAIPDYEWTAANFDNMLQQKEDIKKWRASTAPLRERTKNLTSTPTTGEFMDALQERNSKARELDDEALVNLIFDEAYQTTLAPHVGSQAVEAKPEPELALSRAFIKYITYQLYIFDKYDFIAEKEGRYYRNLIVEYLNEHEDHLNLEHTEKIRSFFGQYIDLLISRNIIDKDDEMYKEFFPMFPPVFVSYAGDWKNERDIACLQERIFKRAEITPRPPVMGSYRVKNLDFHLTSDLHWDLNDISGKYGKRGDEAIEDLALRIISEQRYGTLFLLGDLFLGVDADDNPIDVSDAVNKLLAKISPYFEKIYFVPGNHDMRRLPQKKDPWSDFILPKNVIMPKGIEPVLETVHDVRILVGNLFYNGKFIDPAFVGLTQEEMFEFYASLPDGKALLKGVESIPLFDEMAERMATAMAYEVDIIVSHVPLHPSLVNFRVSKITPEMLNRF